MGNFFIVIAAKDYGKQGEGIFGRGLRLAHELKGVEKPETLIRPNLWVAAFPRQNGSGGKISINPQTGDWLLSAGTWIHPDIFEPDRSEQLLARIREKGSLQAARDLEGFFVIAGSMGNETFVVTDIVGSCHAFSKSWNGVTAISGSSLLLAALDDSPLDSTACQEFIQGGVIYEDRTLFREVRKLEPATHYRCQHGRLTEPEHYWSVEKLKPESLAGSAAIDAMKSAIQAAVKHCGALAPKLLCDLTGGYDSRTLVAGFISSGIPVSTTVSGTLESPDARVAAELARIAGLPHMRSNPEPIHTYEQISKALQLTDGEYDIVEYARVRQIHQDHAQAFDVSLNGSFGEVARGYWWEVLAPRAGKKELLDAEKAARLRYMPWGFDATLFPDKERINLEEHYADVIRRNNIGLENTPNTMQLDNTYLRLRMHRWQGRIASSTNQIWPCLSPFMFRSILDVMLQTDHSLRRRSLLIRKLLPELDRRFAEYPLEHGFPPLPANLRTLHRFWPIVPMYGRKVARRLKRFGKRAASSTGPTSANVRLQLWQQPEIKEILKADRMLSTKILDGNALGGFLSRSQKQEFPCDGQWARVLTLECALRSIKEARKAL